MVVASDNSNHAFISIQGSSHIVRNNNIGGSGPNLTGIFSLPSTSSNLAFDFFGINSSGTNDALIEGNKIGNFDVFLGRGFFQAIRIHGGVVNVKNNSIGSENSVDNLIISKSARGIGFDFVGIWLSSTGNATVSGNKISGISSRFWDPATGAASNLGKADIIGIFNQRGTTVVVEDNVIGGALPNSIHAKSLSVGPGIGTGSLTTDIIDQQIVIGIQNTGSGNGITIRNNVIRNLVNASQNIDKGYLHGIQIDVSSSGTQAIQNNRVEDLTISNNNKTIGGSASLVGISSIRENTPNTTGNLVSGLTNNFPNFEGEINGIAYSSLNGRTIAGNFIIDLQPQQSQSSVVNGIRIGLAGTNSVVVVSNNIINFRNLANLTNYRGIADLSSSGTGTVAIYFNTVVFSGNPRTSGNSYALFTNSNREKNYRNNNLYNGVSSGTGVNAAIGFGTSATLGESLVLDFNNYFVTGSSIGTTQFLVDNNGTRYTDIAAWRTASSRDANSRSLDPDFNNVNGNLPTAFRVNTISLAGTSIAGISADHVGVPRAATPTIGALEYCLDPIVNSFTPLEGSSGSVVTITGANFSGVTAVQFNGISASSFNINSATEITATVPTGSFEGKISLTNACGTQESVQNFIAQCIVDAGTLQGSQSLCSGATTTFTSSVSGGTWSSSAPHIASVDPTSGVVTAFAPGTAIITYTMPATSTCNAGSANRSLTVTRKPIAGAIKGNNTLCGPGTTQLLIESSAIDFDGQNDHISAPVGVYFDDDTYTIEGWAFVKQHNFWQRFIDFGTGTASNNVILGLSNGSSGRPALHIYNANGVVTELNSNEELPLNQWVHVAAVRNGNSAFIYINGKLSASTNALSFATTNVSRTFCYIGRSLWSGDQFLNGRIGEVRIWNSARTEAQIRQNMHAVLAPQPELELYYRFDQGIENGDNTSNTTITDYSGNGRTGTLNSFALLGTSSNWTTRNDASVTSSWSSGTTSVATVGANSGLVTGLTAGSSSITYTLSGTGGCSNVTSTSTINIGAIPAAPSGTNNIRIGQGTVTLSATVEAGHTIDWYDDATSGNLLQSDALTFTTPSISQTTTYYAQARNTALGCISPNRTAVTATISNFSVLSFAPTQAKSGETVVITGTDFNGVTSVKIGGVEVRSFNVVSATEIRAVVAANAKLDNTVSVSTSDFTLSLNGFTFSCLNNGLDFDGVNDFVQIGAPMPLSGSTDFTIEAWVKPAVIDNAWHGFLGLRPTSGFWIPSMWVGPNGSLNIYANGFTNSVNTFYNMSVPNFFTANKWTHVAWVKNGSNFIFYKDGVQVATMQAEATLRYSNEHFTIGKLDNFLNGSIDEVRIWNTVRTANQISSTFLTDLIGNEAGLVAYYNFNQGTAGGNNSGISILNNLTSNTALNGTLTNMSMIGNRSNFVSGVGPVIIAQPEANVSICSGANTGNTLTVNAVGESLTYQWYSNTNNSNTGGKIINDATAATYSAPTNINGITYYYVVVSSDCSSSSTTSSVSAVTITSPPSPIADSVQSICLGSSGSSAISIVTQNNMTAYTSSDIGKIYRMRITGSTSGSTVWGSDVYTHDSYIPRAAVHAGVISNGETKDVFIRIISGQSSYSGSVRNGVTTVSYPAWGLSYEFVSEPSSTTSLVATALSNHTLRWYSSASGGIASTTAPVIDVSVVGRTNYYVSQVNASGCEGPRTAIAAVVNALPVIAYGNSSYRFERTKTITSIEPTSSGATVASYAISPALPAGLSFNTTTGTISGTPTAVVASATYTVTATSNFGCTSTTTFTLETFNAPAPTGLTYSPNTQTVRRGTAINSMLPASTGGAIETYTISPSLPAGLTLDAVTGIISGTLSAQVTGSQTYTITGSNTGGSTSASIILVYNTAPTDIGLNPTVIPENEPVGTTVGTLTVIDIDEGDTHTYTLVSGSGGTDNGSFTISGNTLRTNAVFDFETKSSYSIRVRVTDAGGLTFEKVFTINVTDVDEDNDGDGVMDSKEQLDGTDRFNACSFRLASQSVEPSNAWKSADCDNDGLTNQQEKDRGTNPLASDSDGDGVIDGREVSDGTDPMGQCSLRLESQTVTPSLSWLNGDCNSDGIPNGQNLLITMYGTSPRLQSDGSFTLSYVIRVRNLRPERVSISGIQKSLASTFSSPNVFRVLSVFGTNSGHLLAATNYDGRTQLNVLLSNSSIGGYVTDSVRVDVQVTPNGFFGSVSATARITGTGAFGLVINTPSIDTTVSGVLTPLGVPTPVVIPKVTYKIPDGFSPNRDGINDRFVVIRPFGSIISLEVFNRWGNVVYRSENYNNEWDGRGLSQQGGGDLPEGTYFYIIRSKEIGGKVQQFKGSLLLKR